MYSIKEKLKNKKYECSGKFFKLKIIFEYYVHDNRYLSEGWDKKKTCDFHDLAIAWIKNYEQISNNINLLDVKYYDTGCFMCMFSGCVRCGPVMRRLIKDYDDIIKSLHCYSNNLLNIKIYI